MVYAVVVCLTHTGIIPCLRDRRAHVFRAFCLDFIKENIIIIIIIIITVGILIVLKS